MYTDFLSTCTTLSPPHYPVDDPSATKEASIFNLFRERGMLGGPATGSPGNTGNAPAGVYNPLTFKVEPAPEQNIRNILLSNQHTVVSHDAHAFVDESDYTAQYGASGSRGGGAMGSFRYVGWRVQRQRLGMMPQLLMLSRNEMSFFSNVIHLGTDTNPRCLTLLCPAHHSFVVFTALTGKRTCMPGNSLHHIRCLT